MYNWLASDGLSQRSMTLASSPVPLPHEAVLEISQPSSLSTGIIVLVATSVMIVNASVPLPSALSWAKEDDHEQYAEHQTREWELQFSKAVIFTPARPRLELQCNRSSSASKCVVIPSIIGYDRGNMHLDSVSCRRLKSLRLE